VKEFGTENKHGHLNCFLNVCLQALWQFPKVRNQLIWMNDTRNLPGSSEIKSFVNSLQDFYKSLGDINSVGKNGDFPIQNSNNVRAELFKLTYDHESFPLHEKADAFEALDQILSVIHAWQRTYDLKEGLSLSLFESSRLSCDEKSICFVHEYFGQSKIYQELCECEDRSPVRY